VAHYQVFYDDRDTFFDRDAFWYRVPVVRDRKPLGVWLGAVNGLVPSNPDQDAQRQTDRDAMLACAEAIRDMAIHGKLTTEWQFVGVLVIVTDAERERLGLRLRTDEWEQAELVLEFDA
jgi:hypothetical protein